MQEFEKGTQKLENNTLANEKKSKGKPNFGCKPSNSYSRQYGIERMVIWWMLRK